MIKVIKSHIYPIDTCVVVNPNADEVNKFLGYDFQIDYEEISKKYIANVFTHIKNSNDKKNYNLLFINDLKRSAFPVITHEATHIAMYIFKEIRTEVDVEKQEPFAYLVSYLCKEIMKVLKYYDKRRNTKTKRGNKSTVQ